MAGGLDDLGLVHADQRAQDGQILGGIGALQGLDGLACHLSQTLAGDEGLAALSGGNTIGNAHHAAAHQHREQHIGGIVPDILLRLGVGHHKQVGAAGIGGDLLGQSFNFQFCALRSIRRGRKMDVIQGQTALCHPVSGHRAVNAAGEHIQGTAGGTHGQATLSGYFRAMNIRTVIANLHNDLELGVLHIHPQVVVQPQQVSAQLPHQLRAGHGVGLIRTAGLHLEGLDAVQAVAQILLRSPADGIKVLFADHGTAQCRQTKHGAHPVKGQIHVHVLFFGLHIKGRLGAVHLELAHGLEPVAQDLHHSRLKLVAVQALQGHLALIAHNNFSHLLSPDSL